MKPRPVTIALMCLLGLAAAPAAQAAARVFVSINGTDVGDCSNVSAPCRTLDYAVGQVDAGGEVIVVATGSYAGATVTKSVKINVPSGVIAFTASTVTVNAGASDVVVLRGLTLNSTAGTGIGINFVAGATLFVENCVIDGFGDGIDITADGSRTFINGTTIRNNVNEGILVDPATGADVSIDKTRIELNGIGTNQCGILLNGPGQVTLRESVVANNEWGFCSNTAGGEVTAEYSLMSNNHNAAFQSAGGIARASNCQVTDNGIGFFNFSGTLESRGNNTVRGNGTNTSGVITIIGGN